MRQKMTEDQVDKDQKIFLNLNGSISSRLGEYPDEQIEFTIRELEEEGVVILTAGSMERTVRRLKGGEIEVEIKWYEYGHRCRDVDRYKSVDDWLADFDEDL